MVDIDWSKAPKGTTGAVVANWHYPSKGLGYTEFIPSSGERKQYREGPDAWCYYEAPWLGEGIPPANTQCEVNTQHTQQEWLPVTIRYVGEERIIAHDGENERCFFINACEFRPIRTAEQIAAEDREKAIAEMVEAIRKRRFVSGTPCNPKDEAMIAAVALYDENYRKQVAK